MTPPRDTLASPMVPAPMAWLDAEERRSAPPLADGTVTYADGTANNKEQLSKDIVAFLNWTSEPELDYRHSMGIKVLAFLILMTAIFYALKRKVWSDVHH